MTESSPASTRVPPHVPAAVILRRPSTWIYAALVVAGLLVIVPRLAAMVDKPEYMLIAWIGGGLQAIALLVFAWVMLPMKRASVSAVLLSIAIGATFCTGAAILLVNGAAAWNLERFVATPFIEEIVKAVAVLVVLLMLKPRLRGPLDGLIIGFFVAFGFTIIENMLYTYDAANIANAWQLVVSRLVFQFGSHVLWTGIVGAALAYVIVSRGQKSWLLVVAFASVLAAHLLWDVLGLWLAPILYLGAVLVLAAASIVAFILVRRASALYERRADAATASA